MPAPTETTKLSKQIYDLFLEAILNDIEWSPESKNEVITLQEKTGKDRQKQIQIYTDYENKMT